MKGRGRSQLVEQMQTALDGFGDIVNRNRLRRVVTDSPGCSQEDHRGRDLFRNNHGIMSCAADHAVRFTTCPTDGFFNLATKRRIHRYCRLIYQRAPAHGERAPFPNLLGPASQLGYGTSPDFIRAVAHIQGQPDLTGNYVGRAGPGVHRAYGCEQPGNRFS